MISIQAIVNQKFTSHFHSLWPLKLPTSSMIEIQDYTNALKVLKEYPSEDGLHIDTLLDSDKHGALTYNDFLILPGKISKAIILLFQSVVISNLMNSFPGIGRYFGYQDNQAIHHQGPSPVFSYGYRDGTQHGHPHGSSRRSGRYTQQLLTRGAG